MKVFGLTGGIGAGKSTVGRLFRAAGVYSLDADQLARDAVAPGSTGLAALVDAFGEGILAPPDPATPGAPRGLDRAAVARLVFNNKVARETLNAIVHPEVGRLMRAALLAAEAAGEVLAIYEIPLLFENHLEAMFERTILVAAPEDERIRRVVGRDGVTEGDVRARIAAQMPESDKIARADWIIDNAGDSSNLARQALMALWSARGIAGAFGKTGVGGIAAAAAEVGAVQVALGSQGELVADVVTAFAADPREQVRAQAVVARARPSGQGGGAGGFVLCVGGSATGREVRAVESSLGAEFESVAYVPAGQVAAAHAAFFTATNGYRTGPLVSWFS
jgi:dephospho-CoA kinase